MAQAFSSPTNEGPLLNIVIQVVGTRGDVQPFLAYGKELQCVGHRVRIATHQNFQQLVLANGLEFFLLAGDPDQLMEYMVENDGIFPSISALLNGQVWKNEKTIHEILRTTWHACISDDEQTGRSFVADAIIANPPSFGHIHCAEKLGIPLHIVFTMPWSATVKFPHPFNRSHRTRNGSDQSIKQTYTSIDYFTWVGISRVVNHFRKHTLKLAPLEDDQALSMMQNVPHTYCWSPSLIAKPDDWGSHVDVCGFFFLSRSSSYHPPQALLEFLANGPSPLYIGFGSIIGHNQPHMFKIVRDALKKTGRRAVVCNKLATANDTVPEYMFPLGDCPHDWLFQQVDGVCHHGGAGTTAAGLRAGVPTIVIAFFGDQFFWGNVVKDRGAGPPLLSGRNLRTQDLVDAIRFISNNQEVRRNVRRISAEIQAEQGCQAAVRSFHRQLPLEKMCSGLEPTYAASVCIPQYNLQISWPVAQVLLEAEKITSHQLMPLVTCERNLTNSDTYPTRTQFRIPGNDIPYSDEERATILTNFGLITNAA